eukprot:gene35821-43448_t
MKQVISLFVYCLCYLLQIRAANWAQSSGEISQNTAIPYVPAPAPYSKHWSARYGMATIVTSTTNLSSFSYVYLLGGDSYDGDDTQRNYKPGLIDQKWENGYKNDVWRMRGTEWFVKGDPRLRIPVAQHRGQKIPRTYSKLEWEPMELEAMQPDQGMSYDEWISCEQYFRNRAVQGVDCNRPRPVMWSPRRHHQGVFHRGALYILGGRAREFLVLPQDEAVGGELSPRIENIPGAQQDFTLQKEVSVLKNDVWRSFNGKEWQLVTPGCKAPQSSLIAAGNAAEGFFGTRNKACTRDSDCYGAEFCDLGRRTCVCSMW